MKASPGAGQSAAGRAPEGVGYARDHYRRISRVGARAHSCPFWARLATRGRCAWGGGARTVSRPGSPAWSRSAATSPIPTIADDSWMRSGSRSTSSSTTPACSARVRRRPWPDTPSRTCGTCTSERFRAARARPVALPRFAPQARVVNVVSDAAFEAYERWGGYGSSKAALAQITAVLGTEHPGLRVYAVRPRRHAHADAAGGIPR